jgi:hypothetical protein
VPRMLRGAISAFTRVYDALWRCAADPGPMRRVHRLVGPGSAEQRKGRRTASGTRGPTMVAHSKSVSSYRMI